MTPGQAAYEEDCRRRPLYEDGSARKTWSQLAYEVMENWERYPTPREWKVAS